MTVATQNGSIAGGINAIMERFDAREVGENQYSARCPAHDDQQASLAIGIRGDKILLKCHANCEARDIVDAVGMKMADLFLKPNGISRNGNPKRSIVATYDYCDEDGELLIQAIRFEPKDFRQRKPDGHGGWVWSVKGCRQIPYRLPELLAADPSLPVFVVEGEKDVDRLIALGLVATCNAGGAGKFRAKHANFLEGRHVVILADNDDPGRKHAQQVAKLVHGKAASVKIVEPTGLPPKGDVSDWIDAGGTKEQLLEMADSAAEWEPTQDNTPSPKKTFPAIANSMVIDVPDGEGGTKKTTVPIPMNDIIEDIFRQRDGWPRRVDNVLFVDDPKHGIDWFDRRTTSGMFGWLRRCGDVDWKSGGKLATQSELFAELERTATKYNAIELHPHEPPIAQHYYRCKTPQLGDGTALRKLLDCFRPATEIDRDLIQAAFMTTIWGGPAGCRPAFVITADAGRGVGKTKLAEIIAYLVGGFIDVSAGEDIATLKQRFLSPEGQAKRAAILDNVKTMKLSWAELESLITTPIISGKRMYVGEGQRPNTVTWLITLNGVSLATDMAQRSVIIKLAKGKNDGPWYEDTIRFINENRDSLIGDIIAALRAEPYKLDKYTRWAAWEQAVLSRLPDPTEAQAVILERQGEANCEQDEAEIIEEHFAEQLRRLKYDTDRAQVRIPVATVAQWFRWAVGEKVKTAAVSKRLRQMKDEGQLHRIAPDTSRTYGRGFVWTGEHADIESPVENDIAHRLATQNDKLER